MSATLSTPIAIAPTSPQKLVFSALYVLEHEGAAAIAARPLAAAAGLPVSSIYYHFGDLEHLLESAQREARMDASRWCDAQLEAVGRGAPAVGPLLAALVDDWCETQRPLAFARREAQLAALRDPRHAAGSVQWDALWHRFWDELAARLGLADMAPSLAWLFDGVSGLHLLRWRRPVDRAALAELCDAWAGWMDGRIGRHSPWFERARTDAGAMLPPPPPDDAVADAVAAAAARTIALRGVAGLTHRAVAAEAGVTLGVVSYKFRTSGELLQAAFDAIYRRITQDGGGEPSRPLSSRAEALVALDGLLPERADQLAVEELIMASVRNPALQSAAARLRYLRGRTSGRVLQALLGPERAVAPIDGAIISAFLSGRGRAHICSGRASAPGDDCLPLLARLDRGAGG